MTRAMKALWLKALHHQKVRGKVYRKGTGMLYDQRNNTYCCLGVLEDLRDPSWSCIAPDSAYCRNTTLHRRHQCELAVLNDQSKGWGTAIQYIKQCIKAF